MNTERKDAKHPVTDTQERHATGKAARDEQTEAKMGGNKELKDNWEETRKALRKDHAQLTDADLELKPGREQETIDRVGQRLKKSPEDARRLVDETARRYQKAGQESPAPKGASHTQATHNGHKETPEASESKLGKNTPRDEQHRKEPQA